MKLFEGKYDKLTGILVDAMWYIIKDSKKIYDESGENIYKLETIPIKDIVNFNFKVLIKRKKGAGDYFVDAATFNNEIYVSLYIDPEIEPKVYPELNSDMHGALRHEIEHILQEQKFPQKPLIPSHEEVEKINKNLYQYFLEDYEVEAMVHGFYKLAKSRKETLDTIIDKYLKWYIDDESITEEQGKEIKDKWLKFARKNLPKAQYRSGLVKESFEDYLEFSDGDEAKYNLQRKLVFDPLKGQYGDAKISWEEYMENKDIIDDNFHVEYVERGESPVRILPKEGDEETAWWLEDK